MISHLTTRDFPSLDHVQFEKLLRLYEVCFLPNIFLEKTKESILLLKKSFKCVYQDVDGKKEQEYAHENPSNLKHSQYAPAGKKQQYQPHQQR